MLLHAGMFTLKFFVLLQWLDSATSSLNRIYVDTRMPDNAFPVLRRDMSRLKTNIMSEFTERSYTSCVLRCAERRFCAAINYKDNIEGSGHNCQLTNTTEPEFDETVSEKEKVWTFRKVDVDRSLAGTCEGEFNECQNEGRMIWDPVKPFSCLCKEGYEGELCEKTTTNVLTTAISASASKSVSSTKTSINGARTSPAPNAGPLGESVILEKEPVYFKNNLTEWLPNKGNWSICWRATRDGWASSKFHSNCDGIKPTLTIVQVVKKSKTYVFGGYTTESWNSSNGFKSAPGSFSFSLRNNDDLGPFKAPLIHWNEQRAIFCQINFGPCFDLDWCIYNNAGSNNDSKANIGHRYQPPPGYTAGEPNTKSLLAGSEHFNPSEVEVLYLN